MKPTIWVCVWLCFVLPQVNPRSAGILALFPTPRVAHGQAADANAHESEPASSQGFVFEVPPAPQLAEARFTFDVHTGFSSPLANHSLCPPGAGCVLKSGGGVGGSAERRWPMGLGVLAGYDLWFLDSDSVYELGVQQILRLGLRYTMPTSVVFHPVFELSPGLMMFGDTFRVATVGAALEVLAGSEFELSAVFGLRAGLGVRVFSHSEFRTERDGVLRGRHGTFSESLFLQVGLTFQ